MSNRRVFLRNSAALSAYALLMGNLTACKANKSILLPLNAPYKMNYLKGDVGYFTERGGTIGWMANDDGIVVIDSQFPKQSENLVAELKKLSDQKVDVLINTHHHGDHTAGNIVYKELTDKIVAHTNSKKNQKASAKAKGKEESQLYPNVTFDDHHSMTVGRESINLSYFGAAHTDGDIVSHFERANVVHMGDLIFNRRFPYIDKSAGASISNWVTVLDKVDGRFPDSTAFIFGHSDNGYDVTGTKEDIKAFKNYLERLLEYGRINKLKGITLDEAKKFTTVIPGAEQWKGKGIERSLDAVYQELSL